jgi:hypothetical protein
MLVPILCAVIAGLLLMNAFQCYWHERAMQRAEERWAAVPPLSWIPPQPRAPGWEELRELGPGGDAPTRRVAIPIHPPFEGYGVDVSVAPTIGIR